MSDDGSDSTVTLNIGVPTDASGYLRQECPECGLEFKVKGDETRFTDALAWWTFHAASEAGVMDPPSSDNEGTMTCPYCSASAPTQDFLHREYRDYLKRIAMREIVEPMLFSAFADMERAFSGLRRGPISIRVEASSRHRSPRPIAGPDPDDMVKIGCRACGEHFKVIDAWPGGIACPSCAKELALL